MRLKVMGNRFILLILPLMRYSNLIAAMSCLGSLLINAAISPGIVAREAGSRLSAAQIQKLESLGVKIAVPSYVPDGFRVDKVEVVPCPPGSRRFCPEYSITYRGPKNTCFAIESTGGGIGGLPDGDRSFPVNSPVFGESSLELGKYGQAQSATLLGQWLGESPFYRFAGAGTSRALQGCNNISPQEAVRVTESLQYLNPSSW